ncbi:hypothetical protein OG979_00650 [Actinomadura citrea]|uniref:hypothetical protein n=1 Tax=Actinomadura citrea TaxID=46158 RepID=UPI002E2874DF|nr:hypothetical protein [Actinomadura citrea]
MNELTGLILVVGGIALARWASHRTGTLPERSETADMDESEPWWFAGGLGLVVIGLATLNIEHRGVLLAVLLPGILLCAGLAAIGYVLERAKRRHDPS